MKPLKHSKLKNTGILFELLVRQITADSINGSDSKALPILRRYFSKNTELAKELELYQSLTEERFNSDKKSGMLVDTVIRVRSKLNDGKLRREKYNLIKEIGDTFDINEFFDTKIPNYKVYASIYKVFEYKEDDNPTDMVKSRIAIVENLTGKKVKNVESSRVHEMIKDQPQDVKEAAYEILVEKFNRKYGSLQQDQKNLLREYINNISNTNGLKDYIMSESIRIANALNKLLPKVADKAIKVKLREVSKYLRAYKSKRRIEDSDVLGLLRYQELIHELTRLHGGRKK